MRVLFFAQLRDVTGQPEWAVDVKEIDLDELWKLLIAAFPNLARFRESVRIARNWQYAEAGTRFSDTDEVALIRPYPGAKPMEVQIEIVSESIESRDSVLERADGVIGASVEFVGIVRAEEDGRGIAALEYEAYVPMAKRVMGEIMEHLARDIPALSVRVVHRIGVIPAGEAAICVEATGRHRAEAFEMVRRFLDRLKEDVPIWKRRALSAEEFGRLKDT